MKKNTKSNAEESIQLSIPIIKINRTDPINYNMNKSDKNNNLT